MSESVVTRTFEMRGREYQELQDGTILCDRRGCPGSAGLRCQRTEVPICMKCAVQTPVGYISQDAAKEQADKYFNIGNSDYIIAAVVAFIATFITGFIVGSMFGGFGRFFFILVLFFIGGAIGGVIGEIVRRAINNRRGRYTSRVVGAAMIVASFIAFILTGFALTVLIFGAIATSAAVSRFEIALRA